MGNASKRIGSKSEIICRHKKSAFGGGTEAVRSFYVSYCIFSY